MEGRRSAVVLGLLIVLLIGLADLNLALDDSTVEVDADRKVEETTQDAEDLSARTWGDAAKDWARTVTDFSSKESGKAHGSIKDTASKVVNKEAGAANEGNSYVNEILRQAMDQLVGVKVRTAKIVSDTQEKLYEAFESGKGIVRQKGSESIYPKDSADISKDEISGRTTEATEGLKQKASEAAEKLKDAAGTASEETSKFAEGTAAERAQVKTESVQEKASKLASELGDKIKRTVSGHQQSADRQEL